MTINQAKNREFEGVIVLLAACDRRLCRFSPAKALERNYEGEGLGERRSAGVRSGPSGRQAAILKGSQHEVTGGWH